HAQFADDIKEVTRFQREARAIATLRHPNIVQVYDFGQTKEGFLYLVMECLEGRTLKHIVREEAPIEPDVIVDFMTQVLDGLAEAHARGVIHRDLKPENIFCATIGRRKNVIKILDFGIAKVIDEAGPSMTLTGKGMAVGSPRYMSPEQARAKPVSPQTDLYLVGLIFHELLTGRSVFERQNPTDYLLAHIREPPEPPTVDGVELTGPLVDFMMHCLAKDPADRPESAEVLMKAVEGCRGRGLDEVGATTGAFRADTTPSPALSPELADVPEPPPIPQAPAPPPIKPHTLRLPTHDALGVAPPPPPKPGTVSRTARGRVPAPTAIKRRAAPPLPPGLRSPSARPVSVSPAVVVATISAAVILIGLGSMAYWIIGARDNRPAVSQGVPQPPAAPAPEDSPPRTDEDVATEQDTSAPDVTEEDQTPEASARACTTSRDCERGETCFDGVCEADDD
ncbi:MAG: serine/threonine-protein kinase, partial [Myxococcota bacterium]|nr:serine/threonine-protein kinase [Myxococcota bacterium]